MLRSVILCSIALTTVAALQAAGPVRGKYVEARTCQVYTGPCFANGEVGSAGKSAILTWSIEEGSYDGADLAGRSVAMVVRTSHTLGFRGFADASWTKALLIVDAAADPAQAAALQKFALAQTGVRQQDVAGVQQAEIQMQFDVSKLTATVEVGDLARLEARKARAGDCICSNESAYYPPLTALKGFVPGVTIQGEVSARRLGTRWSIPNTRTAYLGTFEVDATELQLARRS
jgi:hypothetical protein